MILTDKQKARLFDALERDGVDNWNGYQGDHYQEVMEEIRAEAKFEENKEKLEPLFDIISEYESTDVTEPAGRGAGFSITLTDYGVREIVKFISKNFESK